jgi:cystathionine beta-lyase/cystathionine gamma-synthase
MESSHYATLAIHVGSEPDSVTGAVVPPISLATTFAQAGLGIKSGLEDANSHGNGYDYARGGNPSRGAFERCMAAVERGSRAIAFGIT